MHGTVTQAKQERAGRGWRVRWLKPDVGDDVEYDGADGFNEDVSYDRDTTIILTLQAPAATQARLMPTGIAGPSE